MEPSCSIVRQCLPVDLLAVDLSGVRANTAFVTLPTRTRALPTHAPGGEPLDVTTRAQLAEYLRTVHWRRASRDLRVSPAALRRAMRGAVIRFSTGVGIRSGLALAARQGRT